MEEYVEICPNCDGENTATKVDALTEFQKKEV